ncbi:DUF742 domain-containing protein [Streptomyces sp. NPDC054775]
MTPPRNDKRGLVRPYVITEGRAHPTRRTLDLVTLVYATTEIVDALTPEKQRLVNLCLAGALSIAEISALLGLPVSVTKVLVADLVDKGQVLTRSPIPSAELPDIQILQEVLDGLRARL